MTKADFAVSRAGASTLWELCANQLPTFFIPYKHAAGSRDGAMACLIGIAARKSIDEGRTVKIEELTDLIPSVNRG